MSLALFSLGNIPSALGQTPRPAGEPDKAGAYYNFAMAHLYGELAGQYGNRGEYYNKAIEFYKEALKLDPSVTFVLEELTDLYVQGNQLKSAITEAESMLAQDPNNLAARRMLARIYTRSIGDQQGKVDEAMLRKAIEQYLVITQKDPKDLDSWLTLGRLQRGVKDSVSAEKSFKKALELEANNEDALTGLAMVYSDVGDTKNMIEALRQVTDHSPNERSLATLGAAYEEMRDYAAAAEVLKRALALKPENAQIKRALAQDLLLAEQYDEALKQYQELANEDAKDVQAQLRISEIYRHKSDFAKAHAALAKAKEADKASLEVRYEEINLLDAEGKRDEAITMLRGMLDETAKRTYTTGEKASRVQLIERLAELYRDAKQFNKAVEVTRQIAEIEPQAGPQVAMYVIQTLQVAKDYAAAQAEADAALKKYPNDRRLKLAHAGLLADRGQVDAAAAEVRTLLGAGQDLETYRQLAAIYEKAKNYPEMEKALAAAEKLSDSKQDKEMIYFTRGAMYEKQKKYSAAEAEFRKVIESNPKSANALNYLGYMFADRGVRLDEANDLIRKALEIDPKNGAYLDSLGWVNYHLNKLDEAERNLLQSIEIMAGDPTVYDHLGDVYLKEGKVKEAIAQWQLSLKEWEKTPQSDQDPAEVAKVTKKLESAKVRLARESSSVSDKQR